MFPGALGILCVGVVAPKPVRAIQVFPLLRGLAGTTLERTGSIASLKDSLGQQVQYGTSRPDPQAFSPGSVGTEAALLRGVAPSEIG